MEQSPGSVISLNVFFNINRVISSVKWGRLRSLVVARQTTDHYHPCSNLGVHLSEGCFIFDFVSLPLEVARPIQPTTCTEVSVKDQSSSSSSSSIVKCHIDIIGLINIIISTTSLSSLPSFPSSSNIQEYAVSEIDEWSVNLACPDVGWKTLVEWTLKHI